MLIRGNRDQDTNPFSSRYTGEVTISREKAHQNSTYLGLCSLVRSLRQATAGAERAKELAFDIVQHFQSRAHLDPFELDDDIEQWWKEGLPADDLRDIARQQAKEIRDIAADFRLSDNHPKVKEAYTKDLEERASDLEAWAVKPRQDFLELCSADPWPDQVIYAQKHGAKNARLFLDKRPPKVVSSDGTLFSFENGYWVEKTDDVRTLMPKTILIFSDGTGQIGGVHPDQRLSNIYKMYRAMRPGPSSPIKPSNQVAFYDAGLGAGETDGFTFRKVKNLLESAVGTGIDENVIVSSSDLSL